MSENKEKSAWSAKNPYMSKITECYVLNGKGSRKETRHVVFDLGDSGLDYKVGDALGVLSENPGETVNLLIETAGWDESQLVSTRSGEVTLREALKKDFEIHRVNKKFVNSLSEKVTSSGMRITVKLIERYRDAVLSRHAAWQDDKEAKSEKRVAALNREIANCVSELDKGGHRVYSAKIKKCEEVQMMFFLCLFPYSFNN